MQGGNNTVNCANDEGKGREAYQSAPLLMVSEQAAPRAPKSAERIEGAIVAGGDILARTGLYVISRRSY